MSDALRKNKINTKTTVNWGAAITNDARSFGVDNIEIKTKILINNETNVRTITAENNAAILQSNDVWYDDLSTTAWSLDPQWLPNHYAQGFFCFFFFFCFCVMCTVICTVT